MKEIPISKKESGCIPPRFVGDTLSNSRFDFENLTRSEARELPTSGHTSVIPLVGSSLASTDRVRFSKSNRLLFDNVSPTKRGGIQPLSFLDIGISFMYTYNKGQ